MNKIKLMSVVRKRVKEKNESAWLKTVETFAPGMYDSFNGIGEKDSLKKAEELQPEIVLLFADVKNALRLMGEIKQRSPRTMIFVLFGVLDEEEEVFDEWLAHGAYKCYTEPVSMNALFHDMYVALNRE